MEPLLPQPQHTQTTTWDCYPEHVIIDYTAAANAGGSYTTTLHHVNDSDEQQRVNYQYLQFRNPPQGYVISQNDVSERVPFTPSDASMSYWPTAQVHTPCLVSTALPVDAMYYPPSCYGNQDLPSTEPRHAAGVEPFPSGLSTIYAAPYGTAGFLYEEPTTTLTVPSFATAIPGPAPHPTIAPNQGESGHDPVPQDAMARAVMYEGTAATFQATDGDYNQIELYGNPFAPNSVLQRHYAPVLVKEEHQPYLAASTPEDQGQYIVTTTTTAAAEAAAAAPVPVPVSVSGVPFSTATTAAAPVSKLRQQTAEPPSLPPRGQSPMDHLPYPEDVVKTEFESRDLGIFGVGGLSPSSSSTLTPQPPSPILQTLTFITYPETEPKGHGRGGEYDEHDNDDGSPSRRGRRGKKQPKKDPFLACFFCRGRKIACHPKSEGGEDRTCSQCAKRHLRCQYPLTSRRGQRKPQDPALSEGVPGSCNVGCTATGIATATVSTTTIPSKTQTRAPFRLSQVGA